MVCRKCDRKFMVDYSLRVKLKKVNDLRVSASYFMYLVEQHFPILVSSCKMKEHMLDCCRKMMGCRLHKSALVGKYVEPPYTVQV